MRARSPLSAAALLLAVLAAGAAPVLAQDSGSGGGQGGQGASGGAGGGTAGGDTGTGASGSSGTTGDLNAPAGERSTSDEEDPGGGNPAAMPGSPAGAGDAAGMMMGDFPPERVRRVQERLTAAGFDAGPADGEMGERTRAALREFQRARGLDPTGEPNERTLTELGVE
jgi:N-acetylmuramoyl-L-alanine amidase